MNVWPSKTKLWNSKTRKIDNPHSKPNGHAEDNYVDEYDELEKKIKELEVKIEQFSSVNDRLMLDVKYLNIQLEEKNKEIFRLRDTLDKNTSFLQDTVLELVKAKSSISPSVAAYMANKSTQSSKEIAKLP